MNFSNSEKVDMLDVYFRSLKNKRIAAELYRQEYPHRRHPSESFFVKLVNKLRTTGSFERRKRNIPNEDDVEINVLALFEANPRISVRDACVETGINIFKIHRILRKHKYRPYKIQTGQGLLPGDYQRRLDFSEWFLEKTRRDPIFYAKIFWTDEASFSRNGLFNNKNCHYWSMEHPHEIRETRHQISFKINVWCGILKNKIFGPYFYEENLTATLYAEFLNNVLYDFFEEIPLGNRLGMWFQQDGAPAHNARRCVDILNNTFERRVIGTNCLIRWPARSPDMTPLDFFLWGYVKDFVYKEPVNTLNELKNKIEAAIESLSADQIERATYSVLKRCEKCIEEAGSHFEYLL